MKSEKKSHRTILHVVKAYYPHIGGIETTARQLAENSAQKGYKVLVLCCGDKNETADINGVTVYRFRPLFNVGSAPVSIRYALKLWELVRQADIVHFHVPNPIAELAFLFSRKKCKIKTLCTYHLDPVRPKSFVRIYKKLLHRFLKHCDIICPTSPNYVRSSDILQKHQDKCLPIPLGIDVKKFAEVDSHAIAAVEELTAKFQHPRILFCGRFSYYKGLNFLLDAMARIPEASLLLVGKGEKEAELRQQAAALHMEERTAFLGHLPWELYTAVYHVADVFVLPSVYRAEAFGLVGLEAMAAGLPVITTELGGGMSFYNLDGETGFVVPPRNSEALAEAIQKILGNPDLAASMSLKARQRVDDFSVEKMLERYRKLYINTYIKE